MPLFGRSTGQPGGHLDYHSAVIVDGHLTRLCFSAHYLLEALHLPVELGAALEPETMAGIAYPHAYDSSFPLDAGVPALRRNRERRGIAVGGQRGARPPHHLVAFSAVLALNRVLQARHRPRREAGA